MKKIQHKRRKPSPGKPRKRKKPMKKLITEQLKLVIPRIIKVEVLAKQKWL